MISINLLPEELREIERSHKIKVNVAKFGSAAIVVVILALGIVFYIIGQRVKRMAEIKARLKSLTPKSQEAERLITQKRKLEKEITVFESFSTTRLLWNRRLNEISNALPDELFLVNLSYRDRKPYLMIISGRTSSGGGSELVVEFIDNIRKFPDFVKEFPQISYSIDSLASGGQSFEIRCNRNKSAIPGR